MRTIVTVTPNPALDMTWSHAAVRPGGSHRVETGQARAGGKGVNVSRVAHSQVYGTVAVTTYGGVVGDEFEDDLRESGVPHILVPVAAETRRSIAVYDESADNTMIFNEYGVAPSRLEWDELVAVVATVLDGTHCAAHSYQAVSADPAQKHIPAPKRECVLVISGSLPPGLSEHDLVSLITKGVSRGVPTIVDTSGPMLLAAAKAGASLLKPNREELAEATGEQDPLIGMGVLLDLGAGAVLCSLGAEGMLLASADVPAERSGRCARRARLATPLTGNPTGAGDAGVAAAATLAAAGMPLGDIAVLRRATAWSAAAVLMPFAGEISSQHERLERELLLDVVTAAELTITEAGDPATTTEIDPDPARRSAANPSTPTEGTAA